MVISKTKEKIISALLFFSKLKKKCINLKLFLCNLKIRLCIHINLIIINFIYNQIMKVNYNV